MKEIKDGVPSSLDPVDPAVEKEAPPPEISPERQEEKPVENVFSGDGTVGDAGMKESHPEELSSDSHVKAEIEDAVQAYGGAGQVSDSSLDRQVLPETGKAHPLRRKLYRRKLKSILKPVYRTVAAILAVLLVVTAIYYVQGSGDAADMLHGAFENYVLNPLATVKASVLKQAQSGDNEPASIESVEILKETANSQYETALLDEFEEPFTGEGYTSPPQDSLDSIAVMIGSGNLQQAETELDRLRRMYPNSPQVMDLYRKWQSKASASGEEESREESFLETTGMKEEAWNRQFLNFFNQGKYKEAGNVVGLWLGELPYSSLARESKSAVEEIQRRMAAVNTAQNENRSKEALQELSAVEKMNPSDPNIAGLRSEIESRMASPDGTLTVYRLGEKATLLLDGKRIDHGGEIVGERIPVGSHEIILEKDGNTVASRSQEFLEGQTTVLVYDLDQRDIRPMIEPDQIVIDRRTAMEEVHRFATEHQHGILRGNCRGELILSFYEVVYVPVSGSHGFRVPSKLLKLEQDGSTIDLFFISGNEHFQKFEFDDARAAASFRQTWNKLKSMSKP